VEIVVGQTIEETTTLILTEWGIWRQAFQRETHEIAMEVEEMDLEE
jgi:hypothetical protein